MEYPKNGSVIIVDDKIDDVEDLMIAFSKKNVPTFYFTGKEDKLHSNLDNIKIIFLDVDYLHTPRTTKQTKVDYLVTILTKLISPISSDYVIVLWSTITESYHSDLDTRMQVLYDNIETLPPEKKLYKLPKKILSINKGDVKDESGNFDLDLINEKINNVIPSNDIMNLIIYWENNVLKSAKNVLQNFKKIAPTEEEQKKIYALFADSISQSGSLSVENIISPALSPISSLLSDQLSTYRSPVELNEIGGDLLSLVEGNKLDINKVSKINTFYHVDSNILCHNAPGTVYSYQEYMDNYSCSSNGCNTRWAEDLLLKLEEDFIEPNIDTEITIPYTTRYQELKKLRMPFIAAKGFDDHIEIATKKKLDLNVVLKDYDDDYMTDLDETLKKGILERYSKRQNEIVIEELIKFVFDKPLNDDISNILNTCSPNCNFNALNDGEKVKVIEKYFNIWTKKKIVGFHNSKKIPIFLEFSPDCDFVQKNRKKLRLIFGLMYPYSMYAESKKNFNGENYIYTPTIEYNGIPYKVVFDLHTVTGINEEAFSNAKTIFRFRKELLVDIQQKIASHIARPGFFNMNDYLE